MKFSAVLAFFAAGALAQPLEALDTRTTNAQVCPSGLYANPQCCDVIILGLLALGCISPQKDYNDARGFRDVCAQGGKQAGCCVLPVAGQSVLCQSPAGGL